MANMNDFEGIFNPPPKSETPLEKVDIASMVVDIQKLKTDNAILHKENMSIRKKVILLWDEVLKWRK